MKKLIFIVVVTSIISCNHHQSVQKNELQKPVDTVYYAYKALWGGYKLQLLSTNKFTYKESMRGCTGGGYYKTVMGTYQIKLNHLQLYPDSLLYYYIPFNTHNITTCFQLKYPNDSLKIRTEYDIIPWGNKEYLVSPQNDYQFDFIYRLMPYDSITKNGYHRLAEVYNSGYERGRFMWHKLPNKDTLKPFNIRVIPKKWQYLFLEKPITAQIIKVRKQRLYYQPQLPLEDEDNGYNLYTVKINKGRKEGVYVGLTFYQTREASIQITKVNEHTSIGTTTYLLNIKTKNKLTTKIYYNEKQIPPKN